MVENTVVAKRPEEESLLLVYYNSVSTSEHQFRFCVSKYFTTSLLERVFDKQSSDTLWY